MATGAGHHHRPSPIAPLAPPAASTCSPFALLCSFLLAHLCLFAFPPRAPAASLESLVFAARVESAEQLLRALDTQCGANSSSFEVLSPRPRAAPRSCSPLGALEAFARGARPSRDAPFALARGCALKWYTPGEACNLLARAGTLVVVGDSLARHLVHVAVASTGTDNRVMTL